MLKVIKDVIRRNGPCKRILGNRILQWKHINEYCYEVALSRDEDTITVYYMTHGYDHMCRVNISELPESIAEGL